MHEVDLLEESSLRFFRVECRYSAARLNALPETRHLAEEFERAAERLGELEAEEARLDLREVEIQAAVETADDAWDDVVRELRRRVLELSDHNQDHPLYRRFFAEIPSQVTSLSYHAEILISRDLERDLAAESSEVLCQLAAKLESRRVPLEAALHERTLHEVEAAKFQNRAAFAKQLVNKLRRLSFTNLEEIEVAHGRLASSALRFFRQRNAILDELAADGVEEERAIPAHLAVVERSEILA